MARKDGSKKAANSVPAPVKPIRATKAPLGNGDSSTFEAEGPVFSGDVLKKLQQKIQDGMEKIKTEEQGGKKDSRKKEKEAKSKKDKDATAIRSPKQKKEGTRQAIDLDTSSIKPGKKTGLEKPEKQFKSTSHVKPINGNVAAQPKEREFGKKKKFGKKSISDADLLKEIVAMGGTEDDLDLVKDIESDSEEERTVLDSKPSNGSEKDLRGGLEKLFKDIGFNSRMATEAVVAKEEEVEEEEWQDEEGSGGEDEEAEEEKVEYKGQDYEEARKDVDGDVDMTPISNAQTQISKIKGKLLFEPRPDWHATPLPPLRPSVTKPHGDLIQNLYARGKELLQDENSIYSSTQLTKSSDRQFLSTIMTSGTLSDKVSALTLICQESPLHTTKTLETLLGLAKKKGRSQAVAAIAAIKDLFASGVVLPPERKLKPFIKQPYLGSDSITDLHLLVWAFEDWLKTFYFEVLKVLEGLCADQLEFARSHAVGYVWELLKEKPEQEANLLRMLVNKLGDKDKKIASKVSYLLLQLQATHPAMKSIIINAIESEALFRPGNSLHAKYYAIITCNQTIIPSREPEIANKLLDIYFAVFTGLLTKKPSPASGANTVGPAVSGKPSADSKGNVKLSKKAKKKLEMAEKVTQAEEEVNAKLISAVLTGVNRAFPFSKVDDDRFQKHIDTLFKITHSGNFNTSIQALLLIHQVSSAKQLVSDRFYRTLYEALLDQRLVTSSKQAMFLNLLFKALKTDTSMKRVKAFVKRIVQICTMHQPAFICGVFYLLGELETSIPSLRTLLNTPEEGEDEGEEIFRDVLDEDEDEDDEGTSARQAALKNAEKTASESAKKFREAYDGRKRDPAFAYADRTCLWEILPFAAHFHPSVSLFANSYLHNTVMPPKPDLPLHTLSHFLDRFVYKNPRTSATAPKGASIMQPLAGAQEGRGMILSIRGTAKSQVPVNTEAFWKKKLEDVKADEVFFHKYFTQRGETAVAAKKRKLAASATNGDEEKDEEELEDEAEDEVWKALVGSKPELEMDLDGDVDADDFSDDGFEDIEDSDDGGEEEVVGTSEDGSAAMDSDEEEEEEEEEAESTQPVKPTKKAPAATEVDDSDDADSLAHEDADDVWDSDDSIELPMDVDLDLESDPDDADLDAAFEAELELANTMLNPTPSNSKSKSKSSKPKATSPPAFSNKKGKKRAPTTTKDKNGEEDSDSKQSKKKKRKLKHLPTFASADDYAYLLSD